MYRFNNSIYLIVLAIFILSGCDPGPASTDTAVAPGSSRLSELLRDDSTARFPRALTVRPFRFPEDHGAHAVFRNEWWYFTGNLEDGADRRFGYELTLFRFALVPELDGPRKSAWQSNQVYIGHLAVTDAANDAFHVAQRYARGAAGLAGTSRRPVRIWLDDWQIENEDDQWRLAASDDRMGIDLTLTALKPVVLNGNRGLSRKSAEAGNASYYYSIPRLDTAGELRIGDKRFSVAGLSWLDREWGSSALSPSQRGWDWFALQLSDGTDIMVYQIRRNDGSADEFSSGTIAGPAGNVTPLANTDFEIEVLDVWRNERGDSYPARWRVNIAPLDATLQIMPVIPDQELVTNVRYWEGAVDVTGRAAGRPVSGRGYVELTGYADP